MKNNVLLISIVEKCCPEETKMKCLILEKLKTNDFEEALRIANEGLDLGKGQNTAHRFVRRVVWLRDKMPFSRLPV